MTRTALHRLWATANGLKPHARPRKPLPRLLFFTDPERTPDPAAVAQQLPRGAGVVFRAFGQGGADELAAVCKARGLVLLIGADEGMAAASGAHGLHLPERTAASAPRIRARRPGWIVTVAAHSPRAVMTAARLGADAVVVSTAFDSRSASATRPLGPLRLAVIARASRVPVYALGGVDMKNARRLSATGVYGIAAIDGVTRAIRT